MNLAVVFVFLTSLRLASGQKVANIARGRNVAQSSVGYGGGPQRAVDGNRASNWNQRSCTHTNKDRRPWWRLDLGKRYKINTVTVTNRRDCCGNRLNGAEIRIGDRLDDNGNANTRCTVISHIPWGHTRTFQCKGMEGRFVNIVIPNRKEYLTLCEVEVTGEPAGNNPRPVVNIAKRGKVSQSSIGFGGSPHRAVDGNRASDWHQGSCTHTNNDRRPWWRLDLGKRYKITTVTIYNRRDCCSNRLNGAEIRIGDRLDDNGNANTRCAVISSIPAGYSRTFQCKGMEGRFVNIVIPNRKEYLTLCEVEVTGEPAGNNPRPVVNIAKRGKVSQSSIGFGGSPHRAVDENRASDWHQGSCTHTNNDRRPWWRLDLGKRYKITTVTIYNRRDCCSNRLNGAEIRIGDRLDDNGNANTRCAVISSIPAGYSRTFQCKGMEGRFVNVVIPNRKEYLTLCEVEVTGEPAENNPRPVVNIARSGKVSQSSIGFGGSPHRAVDGNRASDWHQGSCTHTNKDRRPWWRLDLGKRYKITTVTIYNRRDCCSNRLNGAEIRIGDRLDDNGNANTRCTVISSIPAGYSRTFQCKGMEGRFVNIVIPNRKEYLTLCEVEVTGEPTENNPTAVVNIARSGKVAQSSIGFGGSPQRAVDGNRASDWHQGSCTHTNKDRRPWWRLDLGKRYKIDAITIYNRRDCCSNRLNGAEIRIGDRLDDHGNANPRCTVISSIPAGYSHTFQCKGMEGRFVNIVIPNRKEYLTLCEVEVTGEPTENIPTAVVNIARGRTVAQSSIGFGGSPQRAVDGNRASDWHQGSCTHTNKDRHPWWRLDLEKRYKINTITIYNRRDCCSNRLNGAEIRIGDRLDDHGNANPRCTVISSIPAGNSQTFQCKGMEGRFVNIVIPTRNEYLTLCEVEVTGEPVENNPTAVVNIAKGRNVVQSSIGFGGSPQRAVDGNRASDWLKGSCTHTNNDKRPWWRLDLEKRYKINTVTIHNRRDCCSNRLNGAEIRIGDLLDDNGNANPRCTVISSIPAGNSHTFQCKEMEGRFVNIVIPNRKEYLTLCEVEVTGEPAENISTAVVNIARGRTVAQSSIGFGGSPQRAVDGNHASDWHQGSCTHTNNDRRPWWRLDLEKRYKINTVTITNRRDCCSNRLNGAEIRIGDRLDDNGNANPRCTVISSIPAGNSQTFQCKGMEGRYVNIVIPNRKEYLTLCEVEVTGEPAGNNPRQVNIARGGTVAQSSIYGGAGPQRAVDGNRASDWNQGSCTHTNKDRRPWWRLDLEKRYKINTVTIHNRRDCCSNRLNGAEIRIGDRLDDNGNANPRCTVISSIPAGNSQTFQCKGMEGRYMNIVIPNRKEYLTLCEVEVTGEPAENIPAAVVNIARGRTVAQSSIGFGGDPQRAVDGNRASDWHQGSCTHTNKDRHPWWRLDLEKRYKINTITIYNRRDCCSNRLNGAEIRIGDRLDDHGNANPRCTVISSIPAGSSRTFQCKGMEGRFVNIVIPTRNEYLTLCEVEVTGEPVENNPTAVVNIARGRTVAQSSIGFGGSPQRAVDGNRASDWLKGSCTHTNNDKRPWWRLDLEKRYKINTVTITNRRDCCSNRLNGAEIRIGDSLDDNGNANPRCTVISSIPAGNSQTFQCKGMEGRYVNIVIPNRKEYLTLCEVEVTSEPAKKIPRPVVNIARGRTVAQSSIYSGAGPQRAIDGNRASDWSQGSCTHTNKDKRPWWRLDLEKRYKISTVTITNRRDCCCNRLNGAEIRIGDRLDDNGNANPRCAVISSIPAGNSQTFQCKGMKGRYVSIVIPNRNEYLTLCEVEVSGEPADSNIARGGKVAQSSIYGGAGPQRAVDGNHASNWSQGSCTHTDLDMSPWWRLDLDRRFKIYTVTITNRGDCCSNRLNGAEIHIGDRLDDNGNANPRCTVITAIQAGDSQTFVCNGMEGRFINIVIPNKKQYLTLCEVEVSGDEILEETDVLECN